MENSTPEQSETERDETVKVAKESLKKIQAEREKKDSTHSDAKELLYYDGNPY